MEPIRLFTVLNFAAILVCGKEIKSLPGLNYKTNFRQFSGYLDASAGHKIHYW